MPGLTESFASVEQQEQFLRHASLTGEDPADNPLKEQASAHIEKVIDKELDPDASCRGKTP